MTARSSRTGYLGLLALGLALLVGCSSGSGSSGGVFFIESCTLGCGNGADGSQVSCSVVNVGRNVEISILFSQPVDPTSLNNSTIKIVNTATGQVPPFTYSVDPNNPLRLIARPNLTFDPMGNPVFALAENETYEVTIPGEAQGDQGPFVRSLGGRNNLSRLRCTIHTSEGIVDPVPGPPTVVATVDTVNANGVAAHGAFDVKLDSKVTMVFNDIMNVSTLANPTTKQATFISVKVDVDGNLGTTSDQIPIEGEYTPNVDFQLLQTTLVFVPDAGFPSRGSGPALRRVVIDIPQGVQDLVGNSLTNAGKFNFTPELVVFPPVELPEPGGEKFIGNANHNATHSGGDWGETTPGRLTYGITGGSGRLGELRVRTGTVLVLNTDSQEFPLSIQPRSLLDNADPGVDYDPLDPSTWPTITVTDGIFEFSRVTIENAATLVLTGNNPGLVYSRGSLLVNGVLDASGESAGAHQSNYPNTLDGVPFMPEIAFGGPGGIGGPNAGSGGRGGDRYDWGPNPGASIRNMGGIGFPDEPPNNPGDDNNGRHGEGLGQDGTFLAGPGGTFYPPEMPTNNQLPNAGSLAFSLAQVGVDGDGEPIIECRVGMVGGPGGGAAYAFGGGAGVPMSPHTSISTVGGGQPLPNTPPDTPGADNAPLGLEPPGQATKRALNHHQGNLRGGSGGGGGGLHLWGSRGSSPPDCSFTGFFVNYWDHSGAGGGGGGGGLQLNTGQAMTINGEVLCSGGAGGSSTNPAAVIGACVASPNHTTPANVTACGHFASPGGGGSGGSLKLKGRSISVLPITGRLNVAGGAGGVGVGGSTGGKGSPGLVRLEFSGNPDPIVEAPNFAPGIAPYMPLAGSGPGEFNEAWLSGAILSIANLLPLQRERPDSFTASVSCWMKPDVLGIFALEFEEDQPGTDPEGMAWNMDIAYLVQGEPEPVLFPYRGIPDPPPAGYPLVGQDFEEAFGNQLNHGLPDPDSSLIAVRFQGARATGTISDLCNVDLDGLQSQVAPGSLTPWVKHPSELNGFEPMPNMIRFTVVFEQALRVTQPLAGPVVGVTNLRIGAQPD